MKKVIFLIIVILGVGGYFLYPETQPFVSDNVKLDAPLPNSVVTSPLVLRGQARLWYFEASFPVEIRDANGKQLGISHVQAQDNWMTEDWVPFEGKLEFTTPTTDTGTLILSKDNPSGLPEYDESVSIPIRFR